jgi:drug/metabolite transporter (DMT)-like permease
MKKNFLRWTGLALSSLGAIILLSFKGDFRIGSDTWLGDFMTLINAASWALFIVKSRSFFVEYHPVWLMKWLFFFGLIVYAPFGIPALMEVNFSVFTAHAWFAVFFVVVMTTFVAYLLNLYGLKIHSPETVSAYIYLQPLLAGTLAIFLGKDELTPTKLLSGILIILGLYLINRKNSSS